MGFEWRSFVNRPTARCPEFGHELPAKLKAKFTPVLLHRRKEIGEQSQTVGNERCDVGVSECNRESAIESPAECKVAAADRHVRRVLHPVHPRCRCKYPQLRKPHTGISQEQARPGSPGNHDGIAPNGSEFGDGGGYHAAGGLESPDGATFQQNRPEFPGLPGQGRRGQRWFGAAI